MLQIQVIQHHQLLHIIENNNDYEYEDETFFQIYLSVKTFFLNINQAEIYGSGKN